MNTFINLCERYGEQAEVTLADYQELNPAGTFEIVDNEIRELNVFGPYPQDYEIVASRPERVTEMLEWNEIVRAMNS